MKFQLTLKKDHQNSKYLKDPKMPNEMRTRTTGTLMQCQ